MAPHVLKRTLLPRISSVIYFKKYNVRSRGTVVCVCVRYGSGSRRRDRGCRGWRSYMKVSHRQPEHRHINHGVGDVR